MTQQWLEQNPETFSGKLYAWLIFGLLLIPTYLAAITLPKLSWRSQFARTMIRTALRLTGISFRVVGRLNLPKHQPYIVVANHESYLDAMVLGTALPAGVRVTAKSELKNNFLVRTLVRGLGGIFVERFNSKTVVKNTDQIAELVKRGQSVAFFAEGGIPMTSGLSRFRMGAFVVAARTGKVVVPVAIRGTRTVLPDGKWLPRRASITISISPCITPHGTNWAEAIRLRDSSHAEIQQRLAS